MATEARQPGPFTRAGAPHRGNEIDEPDSPSLKASVKRAALSRHSYPSRITRQRRATQAPSVPGFQAPEDVPTVAVTRKSEKALGCSLMIRGAFVAARSEAWRGPGTDGTTSL